MDNDQFICTHYSCFENMGQFVTLKKRSKIGIAKSRVQKQGHCYSKREEAAWLALLNKICIFILFFIMGPFIMTTL